MIPTILATWCACDPGPVVPLAGPADPHTVLALPVDQDGDGSDLVADCDDLDPEVHPGAPEVCDGIDDDCDALVDGGDPDLVPLSGFTDSDGDGFGRGRSRGCLPTAPVDGDCDDEDPLVHPGALETCDPADEDCDGLLGEADPDAALDRYYEDADGDGLGAAPTSACGTSPGVVDVDGDCDDRDATLPGEWRADDDGDGAGGAVTGVACAPPTMGDLPPGAALDCDDTDPGIHPGASEACGDGIDQDCDALVDCEEAVCAGPVCGEVTCSDGVDDDLDGTVDCDDDDCWGIGCHVDGVRARILAGRFTLTRDYEHETAWSYGLSGATWTESHKIGVATGLAGEVVVAPPGQRFSTATTLTTCGFTVAQATLESSYEGSLFTFWDVPEVEVNRQAPARSGVVVDPGCRLAGDDWLPQELFLADGAARDPVAGRTWYGGGGDYHALSASSYSVGQTDLQVGSGSWTADPTSGAFWPADPDDDDVLLGAGWSVAGLAEGWGTLYHPGDGVGLVLAVVGDQNGDGIDDLAIGTPDLTATNPEGAVALVSGVGDGPITLADAFATRVGESSNDGAGVIGSVGDLNGDGVDDLAVGARYAGSGRGYAYVVHGPLTGSASLATADAVIDGAMSLDHLGTAIGGAGDVDGDGKDDLLVGAPGNDADGTDRGAVYLLSDPVTAGVVFAAVAIVNGDGDNDELGAGLLGSAGDVDGDGLADPYVCAPGAVHVFRGPLGGSLGFGDAPTRIGVVSRDSTLGSAVAAGDFDGDGLEDLAVGEPDHDGRGAVWVITGVDAAGAGAVDHVASARIAGAYPGDAFGSSVAATGDRDGDGRTDLVVGASRGDVVPYGAAPGAAWLVSAPFAGVTPVDEVGRRLVSPTPGDLAGITVVAGSDLDGDAVPDIVVGAPLEAGGGTAYLVSGASL